MSRPATLADARCGLSGQARAMRLAVCLAGLLLPPLAAAQEPQEPVDSFVDRISVTAVELMIDVRDPDGVPVIGLEAADFEVLEDGQPMKVLGVDYPPRPEDVGAAVSTLAPEAVEARAELPVVRPSGWRSLIYFDMPLMRRRTLRRSVETLLDQVEELVALGPVEVVVANPDPQVVLPFTREGERLRRVLEEVRREPSDPEVVRLRRSFLNRMDMRFGLNEQGEAESELVLNLIRGAVREEFLFLDRRLRILGRWIGAYGHAPASAAILVSDGFDMAPADFYIRSSGRQLAEAQLTQELVHYRLDSLTESLAREMAAHGWTSIALAFGAPGADAADASLAYRDRFRSIGESSDFDYDASATGPTSILERPIEALYLVASETGGEVSTAGKTAVASLGRIGDRLRLTYQAERPSDGQVHSVQVRLRNGGGLKLRAPKKVRSPTPEQVATSRVQRLMIAERESGDLPVSIRRTGLGPGQAKGERRDQVETVFDLNLLRPVLEPPSVPIAFTFGVEIPGEPPLVRHVVQEVTLPPQSVAADWPQFSFKVVLAVPENAGRLSVVVEEPKSGMWGGFVTAR